MNSSESVCRTCVGTNECKKCQVCNIPDCENEFCEGCDLVFCVDHCYLCTECEEAYCDDCLLECCECKNYYCTDCMSNLKSVNICNDCVKNAYEGETVCNATIDLD